VSIIKRRTGMLAGAVALVLIAAGTAGAFAALHSTANSNSDVTADFLAALGSDRVQSLKESDSVAVATGSATTQGGDAARTLWYELVAGSALAETDGLEAVSSRVVGPAGETLYSSTDDAVSPQTPSADPLSSSQNSASHIQAVASKGADALGLQVVDVNYVGLFGGTAEVVVYVKDMQTFEDSAMTSLTTLVKPFTQENRPYLVTFVDGSGAPQLVVGHLEGIGSDTGQGVSWQAPGVDALIGTQVAVAGG